MDAIQLNFALHADRPLLGAFALAACLAGGTATQNHAGVPRSIDVARFAAGWEAGAPRQPDRTISALAATLAPPAAAAPPGAVSRVPVQPAPARLAAAQRSMAAAPRRMAVPTSATPPVERAAALAAAAVAVPAGIKENAAPMTDAASPGVAAQPIADLAAVPVATPVAQTAMVRTIEPAPAEPAPLQLVDSPELRRFDLARFSKAPPRPAKLGAARKASAPLAGKTRTPDRLIDGVVYHHASVEVAGQSGGEIAVRIGPDMKPSVKVADLLGLVSAQIDPDTLARFQLAGSASEYVSFTALRSAGFEVKYNAAADSIAISVAP